MRFGNAYKKYMELISVALRLFHKKCSDTVVGLELLVCLSTGLRMFVEAVLKSTFGFSHVMFVTVVTLYHVDNVFGVAVNMMINKSSFAGRI